MTDVLLILSSAEHEHIKRAVFAHVGRVPFDHVVEQLVSKVLTPRTVDAPSLDGFEEPPHDNDVPGKVTRSSQEGRSAGGAAGHDDGGARKAAFASQGLFERWRVRLSAFSAFILNR